MFHKPTVLVVGAGASSEFELPLGSKLMEHVGATLHFRFEQPFNKVVSGDPHLASLLIKELGDKVNDYTVAANKIVDVLPGFNSMDEALNYLSENEIYTWVGKVAIAHCMLRAERASILRRGKEHMPSPDAAACSKTWAYHFLKACVSGNHASRSETNF